MQMMQRDELLFSLFKTVSSTRDMPENTYTGTGLLLIRHHIRKEVARTVFLNAILGFVKFCRMFGA